MSHTGDDDSAAHRLRLLQSEYLEPSRPYGEAHVSRTTTPSAPIRLGIADHIHESVNEVEQMTRSEVPDAGARPEAVELVYAWAVQKTRHLDAQRQMVRDTVIYRQSLEHAIAMGDHSVIRRHPCPNCRTWGLFWRASVRKAVCVNRYCVDDAGRARSWELAYLAHRHITARAARTHRDARAT
ncbi:hypothetical protein [Streptomyces fradiae]|uniref:hypothetical protein n=1 Tax=Streptomyces fradiae TaxID=1906 RepID=UPI00370195BD